MKRCNHCGIEKPETDFYTRILSRDGLYGVCKVCHRKKSAQLAAQRVERKGIPGRPEAGELSEVRTMQILQSLGIPAQRNLGDHTDVLAYGIVRIEVKSSNRRDGNLFSFSFGNDQRMDFQSDVIVLACIDLLSFHVFPADHPVFFWQTGNGRDRRAGERKTGVAFKLNPRRNVPVYGEIMMTRELMKEHLNRWDYIEAARIRRCLELKNTSPLDFEPAKKFPTDENIDYTSLPLFNR